MAVAAIKYLHFTPTLALAVSQTSLGVNTMLANLILYNVVATISCGSPDRNMMF